MWGRTISSLRIPFTENVVGCIEEYNAKTATVPGKLCEKFGGTNVVECRDDNAVVRKRVDERLDWFPIPFSVLRHIRLCQLVSSLHCFKFPVSDMGYAMLEVSSAEVSGCGAGASNQSVIQILITFEKVELRILTNATRPDNKANAGHGVPLRVHCIVFQKSPPPSG
jgi:hypothetical protein